MCQVAPATSQGFVGCAVVSYVSQSDGIEEPTTLGTLAQVLLAFRFRRKTWDLKDTLLAKLETATLRTPHSH